ncbi:X2-like carbohydrate binding domain-containing protein [Herbiconiux sp. UC225_62]|uniref:X2-like carbohydrate binding domain-containing protein n=1 Tax=Herbiconiux sp. UC225_62 TaxID=3350168 RepID=UPI0036D24FFA
MHERKKLLRTTIAAVTAGVVAISIGLAGAGTAAATEETPPPESPATPAASDAPEAPAATDAPAELATKPYLGWSSYSMQVYSGDSHWITADQIIAQSDAMHEKLQPFGYDHINVDSGWNGSVDGNGLPVPSTELYPDGLQTVIDHVHANGQKFGLYFIPGISPDVYEQALPIAGAPECTTHDIVKQPIQQADYWNIGYRLDFSNPCSQKYIDSIANLLDSWGVDFVKFDSVTPGSGVSDLSLDARDDVAAWSQALHSRGIWFELSWALDINYADYWKEKADGWRVDWDVECYCAHEALTTWDNIARLFPRMADWWRHGGPGGWNDLDSLDVGNGSMDGLTRDERRTATTLWAISAAPMYLGNDLTQLDQFGLDLVTNKEVLAVDQAGTPAQPVSIATKQQVWYALNADGTYTVALFNLGRTEADVTANWADLGLAGGASVRDLWAGKNLGSADTGFTAEDVPIHGVRLLKVTPEKKATLTVNDDSLRVSYDGDWARNGNNEVAATSQPLTVSVFDSSTGDTPPTAPADGRTVAVNDNDPGIVYTGSWGQSGTRGLGDFTDDVHYVEANGSSFQYTFQGTGIDYVTETHESQGDVDVYLDGVFQQTVSTHLDPGAGRGVQVAVWSASGLPNGSHTLQVVKKSGAFMLLDKLDVTLESLLGTSSAVVDTAAPTDIAVEVLRDPSELVGLSHDGTALTAGTDYDVSGSTVTIRAGYLAGLAVGDTAIDFAFRGDLHDDVDATTVDGDSVSFAFHGTGVSWIGPTGPDQGTVEVRIDGATVATVDTHSDARLTAQPLFTSAALKDGDHTITVVKTSGTVLRHDAFAYTVKKVK